MFTNHSLSRRKMLAASAMTLACVGARDAVALAQSPAEARLTGNENPYGPSESARRAMAAAIADGNRYDLDAMNELRAAIAAREGLTADHVVLGAGSSELLSMAAFAFGIDGGEIVAADPTFGLLQRQALAVGARVHSVPLDQTHTHDLEEMARRTTQSVRLVYVCNPNNPTGTYLSASRLRPFCEDLARRTTVLVDEAYLEYVDPSEQSSMVDLVRKGANVVVLRTFSKVHGLAGMRIGYGLARPELAERLRKFGVGNLNRLGLKAALATLKDAEFVESSRRKNAEVRASTAQTLASLGVKHAVSHANFLWVDVGERNRNLPALMAKRGVRLTWTNAPLTGDWMRVTVGTADEMRRFGDAIRASFER